MIAPSNKVFFLKRDSIQDALEKTGRQYFVGSFSNPQLIDHLNMGKLEIGSSLYKFPKYDAPHYHEESAEIIYVLRGLYRILVLGTNEEYDVGEGDFIVLPSRTAYVGKAIMSNTQTFFVKHGGNDKVPVEITEEIQSWLEK